MSRISRPQQIFSEIELFLEAGKYEDAKVLSAFLEHDALDRESRLHLLLIHTTLDGPAACQDEIDRLRNLLDPSPAERELIRKIFLVDSKPAEERARNDSCGTLAPTWPNDQAPQPLEQAAKQYEQLLRAKEAALSAAENRFGEVVGVLERQLGAKQDQLEQRDAEIQAIRANLARLTAQIEEIDRAKDREVRPLRDSLARKTELLQEKDAAMKKTAERLGGQINALEDQLGEKQYLLEAHETEINALIAKMAELNGKHAELSRQREESERSMAYELREKTSLLQAAATAIDDLKAQSEVKIEGLKCELTEKQILLAKSGAERAELRSQIDVLAERLGEAEKARNRTETLRHEERYRLPPGCAATLAGQGIAAGGPIENLESLVEPLIASSAPDRDGDPGWPNRFVIGWNILPKPKTLSTKALAIVGAGLLILPLAYAFWGSNRAASDANRVRLRESALASPPVATKVPLAASGIKASRDGRAVSVPIELSGHAVKVIPPRRVAVGRPTDRPEISPTYITRRAVALREAPRFAATSMAEIRAGTFVRALAAQGQWLKVRIRPAGPVGYVRKEFLARPRSIQ